MEIEIVDDVVEVAVPLNVAFANPKLLPQLGLGNVLAGLASEAAYANDEQIDNQLRSVLFQIPGPGTENPLECLDGEAIAECFTAVNDLGALDITRAYDHGMASYNDLRQAYGLAPVTSFTELTGESTEEFPDDPAIDPTNPIDDPDILDFVFLADGDGNELERGSDEADGETVTAIRRTTTAARLKAIFATVDEIDAFTGMLSEPHVAGTEFGELQLAIREHQFQALRDGDRFFYGNDPVLDDIAEQSGVDYRQSLAEVIAANTSIDQAALPANVFVLDDASAEAGASSAAAPQQPEDAESRDEDGRHEPEPRPQGLAADRGLGSGRGLWQHRRVRIERQRHDLPRCRVRHGRVRAGRLADRCMSAEARTSRSITTQQPARSTVGPMYSG